MMRDISQAPNVMHEKDLSQVIEKSQKAFEEFSLTLSRLSSLRQLEIQVPCPSEQMHD